MYLHAKVKACKRCHCWPLPLLARQLRHLLQPEMAFPTRPHTRLPYCTPCYPVYPTLHHTTIDCFTYNAAKVMASNNGRSRSYPFLTLNLLPRSCHPFHHTQFMHRHARKKGHGAAAAIGIAPS